MDRKQYYRPPVRRQGYRWRWLRPTLLIVAGIVVLFVVGNAAMWIAYRGRVLPNVHAAQLPKEIVLTYKQTNATFNTEKAGITTDEKATKERLKTQRSWLPLTDVLRGATMPAVLKVNEQKFTEALREIEPSFEKPALPVRIVFSGEQFAVAQPEPGYSLDKKNFTSRVQDALARGRTKLDVPIVATGADSSGAGLNEELVKLNAELQTKITFSVNGQPKQPSKADMGSWFVPATSPGGETMTLSIEQVQKYVQKLDPSAYNPGNAAAAVSYAFDKKQEVTFVVANSQTPAKYTYCADARGVAAEHMPNFIAKVAAVLGDPRGWSAGGKVGFNRVESNCNFTVWLSASSQMTSFGGLCDATWSCRSGRNVVINFDRWQGATPAWNAASGGLEDYRVMVTNHEVGHWLGFGHSNCSGPGLPAPVMQQQSINLQGCTFNPWPTSTEINTLKANKGVASITPREEYIALAGCACGRHDV